MLSWVVIRPSQPFRSRPCTPRRPSLQFSFQVSFSNSFRFLPFQISLTNGNQKKSHKSPQINLFQTLAKTTGGAYPKNESQAKLHPRSSGAISSQAEPICCTSSPRPCPKTVQESRPNEPQVPLGADNRTVTLPEVGRAPSPPGFGGGTRQAPEGSGALPEGARR